MSWFQKKLPLGGQVLFPSNLPPRAEDFAYLAELGMEVGACPAGPEERWALALAHPVWGKGRLSCGKGVAAPIPQVMLNYDKRLTDEEKGALKHAKAAVKLQLEPSSGHVLRDRKYLLRIADAVCGTDGLAMVDALSSVIWTAAAMQDELSHEADLDVDGVFVFHALTEAKEGDGKGPVFWAHTHGLREVGKFDFDLIMPSDEALGVRTDFMRGMAFAILEDRILLDGEAVQIVLGDAPIRMVSAGKFRQRGQGPGVDAYRAELDDYHIERHGVACDAEPKGFFGRLFGAKTMRPSRVVSGDFPDGMLIGYSSSSSALMADRARKTLNVFAQWREEFAAFEPTCIAKLGFETTGGGKEYPWFEVHALSGDSIDATCVNDPYHIAGLKKGDRATYPAEQIYDWMMLLPFATLSPRAMPFARRIRSRRAELLKAMGEAKGR